MALKKPFGAVGNAYYGPIMVLVRRLLPVQFKEPNVLVALSSAVEKVAGRVLEAYNPIGYDLLKMVC